MTIYDIAAECGVSISTVSRVLNAPHLVKPATRKKVQSALAKHNYTPNAMARGLVYNTMKTIGILSNNLRHLSFSTTAFVLEDLFFRWGYSSMVCNTGEDLEKKQKYIRILSEKKVDGLVLIGSIFNEVEIEQMIRRYLPETPVVISNGILSLPNAYSVLIDHDCGLRLSVQHLAERGHSKIGLVRSTLSYNAQRKVNGFFKAMREAGFPSGEDTILSTANSLEGGGDFADSFLEEGHDYTALIFTDDLTALGAVKRFRQLGRRVPEDVAVIGCDDSIFCRCSEPTLTSIDTKAESIATVAANTLHDAISKREIGSTILLTPSLVVRKST